MLSDPKVVREDQGSSRVSAVGELHLVDGTSTYACRPDSQWQSMVVVPLGSSRNKGIVQSLTRGKISIGFKET